MKAAYKFVVVSVLASACLPTAAGWFDTIKRLECGVEDQWRVSRAQLEFNLSSKKANVFGPGYGDAPGGGLFLYAVVNFKETKDTLTFGGAGQPGPMYEVNRKSLKLTFRTNDVSAQTLYGQCQVIDKFEFKMLPMDKNQL
jgi:hypothetical protein